MFDSILIANRGEIACRLIRTAEAMGLRTIAVFSEADRNSAHVTLADEAVCIGPAEAAESYANVEAVLKAAAETRAQAIHPGYGFLSENLDFARRVGEAGLVFVGPTVEQISVFGSKHLAREAALAADVPLMTGSGLLDTPDAAVAAAEAVGYPVMVKASGGGGGIGMQACNDEESLRSAFATIRRLAETNFADPSVFLERYVPNARHVEVQVFGDGAGRVMSIGDRDCTVQRRHQKVIEEAPAPGLPRAVREKMHSSARDLCATLDYRSVGTVEFVYDADREEASFLEVNTRIQVEHPVTETVTGIDLVEWMIRLAQGDASMFDEFPVDGPPITGHAIEARIYAENPWQGYAPSAGHISYLALPGDMTGCSAGRVRVDTWIEAGQEISTNYDPLLAKVIVGASDRDAALEVLGEALAATRIEGVHTNLGILRGAIKNQEVVAVRHSTSTLDGLSDDSARIDVIRPGTMTTVQDWPGRIGYWEVGIPPSGPMDDLSFRAANELLGNDPGAPGLECTFDGPTLRFTAAAYVCVTGAPASVTLDGDAADQWSVLYVPAGGELRVGEAHGPGMRTYIAIAGGLDVPEYLGSAATFTPGALGGYAGRALRAGDVLLPTPDAAEPGSPAIVSIPEFGTHWDVAVTPGPQPSPDYFTESDLERIYAATWSVQVHAGRSGVRLNGPKPEWARTDGGEAGLHPSNLHDTPYSVGAVNFTGDTPAVLGPDGPSLGGFACPVTLVSSDRWKLGQMRPDDTVRFVPVTDETARELRAESLAFAPPSMPLAERAWADAASDTGSLFALPGVASGDGEQGVETSPAVLYRRGGDDNILVEYGPMVLDLGLRMRVHALGSALAERAVPGIIDITPGVRSLHVHFDPAVVPQPAVLDALLEIEAALPSTSEITVPSREIHLPLSWDDPVVAEAIARYENNVRDDARFNPSNIEFIRRINGLDSIEDVRRIVFDAQYLVLGLGDVYLGAPLAVPIDPRHRLVTTKYNPARTYTAEATVGIGGSYLCIYGMDSPGGYQLVGRTVPIWSGLRQHGAFEVGTPWLLRFFDRIVWEPVSAGELLDIRADFLAGRSTIDIREGEFSFGDYERFLAENAASIESFRAAQSHAFAIERDAWEAAGEFARADDGAVSFEVGIDVEQLAAGEVSVDAPMTSSVWTVHVDEGDTVEEGQRMVTLEAMKLEMPVFAATAGVVSRILVKPGDLVNGGSRLVITVGPRGDGADDTDHTEDQEESAT